MNRSKARLMSKTQISCTVTTNTSQDIENEDLFNDHNPKVKSIFTQVGFDIKENDFVFSCEFEGNDTKTQVNTPYNFVNNFNKTKTEDKSCGVESLDQTSCLSCNSFHGFQSIESEQSLKDITGVTFKVPI